jgi:hypothetical protein
LQTQAVSPLYLGRNAEVGKQRADEINAGGGKAFSVVADVLEENDLAKHAISSSKNMEPLMGL